MSSPGCRWGLCRVILGLALAFSCVTASLAADAPIAADVLQKGGTNSPGMFAKTDELIALTKVVARHGGLYVSHIRGEGSGLIGSIQEALEIGRAAGTPVHISHLKAASQSPRGLLRTAAKLIEEARADGLTVTADQYPYIASSTSLTATLFPATEIPGGLKDFAQRVQSDPEFERAVRQIVQRRLGDKPRIMLAACQHHPQWVGKSLADIAAELKVDLPAAAIRIQVDGGASVVRFAMSEELPAARLHRGRRGLRSGDVHRPRHLRTAAAILTRCPLALHRRAGGHRRRHAVQGVLRAPHSPSGAMIRSK